MNKKEIVRYYEACESDYRLFWDLDSSLAMHAGFWDKKTKTLRDALRRENEVLAEIAHIRTTDHVLDAGCGVGGSAIFLAQRYQCQVTGITLSAKQVLRAQEYLARFKPSPYPHFYVMDYTATSFPDQSFDVIWALESVCHAQDKNAFIREAFRLLKPGGRLIVADGFLCTTDQSVIERQKMQTWLQGWGVSTLETLTNFHSYLKTAHFQSIRYFDMTTQVTPSSRRLYLYSIPSIFLSKIAEKVGWRNSLQTANLYSARYQYQMLKKKIWQYGVFYAEK
jgi:cyclopropane fatty-acyl-phospholipid synthase-like methyltransferase